MRSALARALLLLLVGATLLGAVRAAEVSASSAIRPAPGTPDPRKMVLTVGDLGGAKVTSQGYFKDNSFPSVISYARELEGGSFGSVRLEYVGSAAEIGKSAATSAIAITGLRKYLDTKKGRDELAKVLLEEIDVGGVKVTFGKPRSLGVGQDSFHVLISIRGFGVTARYHIAAFRVEQVLGVLEVFGEPPRPVSLATVRQLATIMANRMSAELVPRNTALPTIAGTPTVGQTLTASTGTWSGSPSSYGYQWQRCDVAGAVCADITGATGSSYVVTDADLGATIRVLVTATSTGGSSNATSAATGVVQPAGAPVPASPPTITGTAQIGQTLTGSTGVWGGSPTSFAFQWQRCDVSSGQTGACADIPGATSGTYVVSEADKGKRIRLAVTATNATGSGRATSDPTATVP